MWGVETWGQYSISGGPSEIGVMASAAWASPFYPSIRPRRTNRWQFPAYCPALSFTPGRRLLRLLPSWHLAWIFLRPHLVQLLVLVLSALDHIGCGALGVVVGAGMSALDHIWCGASGVVVGAGMSALDHIGCCCVGCC